MNGYIIRILSKESVLVNLGLKQGVHKGMTFEIFEPGEEIIDPNTHKSLGSLDYTKVTVEATQVYEQFSVMQSVSRTTETVSKGVMSAFADRTREVTHLVTHQLPIDENDVKPQLIKNKKVVVGDPVRSIK